MKLLKILLVLAVVLGIAGFFAYRTVHVEVNEADLPQDVYDEDSDLLLLVNTRLIELFITGTGDEYTLVEETVNLIILDAIRDNVNEDYDPLGSCETIECNYITSNENYYVNYVWAELTDDNQLIVHVSVGSDKFLHINTIIDLYFDIDIDYLSFGFVLTLDTLYLNEMELSLDTLDTLLGYADKDAIEASINKGELDLDEYSYTLTFSILP